MIPETSTPIKSSVEINLKWSVSIEFLILANRLLSVAAILTSWGILFTRSIAKLGPDIRHKCISSLISLVMITSSKSPEFLSRPFVNQTTDWNSLIYSFCFWIRSENPSLDVDIILMQSSSISLKVDKSSIRVTFSWIVKFSFSSNRFFLKLLNFSEDLPYISTWWSCLARWCPTAMPHSPAPNIL